MARKLGRLTALEVSKTKTPGLQHDGGGLYLQVRAAGADERGRARVTKSWLYRFTLRGKADWMGLGGVDDVSLAQAREKAEGCRRQHNAGINPVEARDAEKKRAASEAAKAVTFDQCRAAYTAAHRSSWRNAKHRAQWDNTLATYAAPIFGALPVQAVDTGLVLKVLEPIWSTKPETAGRVRGRIETVLDWATARGYRKGENPARWRGHLENLLPKRAKVRRVRHHPALPFEEVPAFLRALRQHEGIAAQALELLILTAARTGEVIGARPGEIQGKAWVIPAERMKGKREHRVPLSARALEILREVEADQGKGEQLPLVALEDRRAETAFVFPGAKRGKPLSNMAMLELMRGMARADGKPWTDREGRVAVPHGFRSSFRDWASERTTFPGEVVEMALAHAISDKTEAAYRRGDLFEKRRRLMDAWARHCASVPQEDAGRGKVVALAR